jgi:GTP-binding protein EngB required for normal cell division
MSNPAPNLNDNHRNALLSGFKYIDRLLGDGLAGIASVADEDAVFSPLVPDATPLQRKVVVSQIARIRRSIRSALSACEIRIRAPTISAVWSLRSLLTAASVSLEELGPKYLKGYGPLDDESAGRILALQAQIRTSLDELGHYLAAGLGGDLSARLARLSQTRNEVGLLRELDRVVNAHGLVEFRPSIAQLIGRLERNWWTIAFVGRVSCGKSSLLNHLLATDVLPAGVTPITAVPIRIISGASPKAMVSFATGKPEHIAAEQLAEFASEDHNPCNVRHVADILLELPAQRLTGGVCLVDTPGLGSLATADAMQTLAFLPQCDLGVLLVDAVTVPDEEDVSAARALIRGGAEVLVVVSKADLLTAPDREKMRAYVGRQFSAALGGEIPVALVSVAAGHEELTGRWWTEILGPRQLRHRELATSSLRRKIGALREAIVGVLSYRGGENTALPASGSMHAQIGSARAAIDEARRRAYNLPIQATPRSGEVLDVATKALARLNATDDAQLAFARELDTVASRFAGAFESLLNDTRAVIGRTLPAAALPLPSSRPLFDPAHVIDTKEEWTGWRRWPAGTVRRAVLRRQLRKRIADRLDDALRHYGHALVGWSHHYLDDLAEHFNAQAGPVEAMSISGSAHKVTTSLEMSLDLNLLQHWETRSDH